MRIRPVPGHSAGGSDRSRHWTMLLAVTVLIAVSVGSGALAVARVSAANTEVVELSTRNVARLNVLGDIRGEQARINDAAANLNAPHGAAFRAGVRRRARQDLARMDRLMTDYQGLVKGTPAERNFARLMAVWRVFRNGMRVYIVQDPPIPGEPLPPGPEHLGEMTISVTGGLDAQAHLERADAVAAGERQEAAYRETIRQVVGALAAGLLLAGVMGVLAARAYTARRRSQVRFRALVQSSSDVIGVLDGEGRLTYVSPSVTPIMGYVPERLIGTSYADLIHPADLELVRPRSGSLVTGDAQAERFEVRIRHADGAWHWHEIVSRDLTGDPAVRGIVVNHRDISERRGFLEHLQESNAHLRALTGELESFSSSVAHDLRAPLRAISGHAEIIVDEYADRLSPDAVRSLEKIESNAARMGDLIDALLSFSRMRRRPVRLRETDLSLVAQSAWDSLALQRADREIDFRLAALPGCQGEPDLLRQVLINLLDNAVKFTRDRPAAEIEVGAWPGPDGFNTYFVKDNGAGFDPAYADQLFKPFHRLHSTAEYPGTGIGLSIVERVIARHGGRMSAQSVPGEGAVFSFTLPASITPAAAEPSAGLRSPVNTSSAVSSAPDGPAWG